MIKTIDSKVFRDIFQSGANNLNNQFERIDALNVFPVPDGDTGTNMSMTFSAGVNEMLQTHSTSVSDLAKVLSKGLLMGARGNSGVILSQIFRGFYQSLDNHKELNSTDLAKGFSNGAKVAYKAVMKPVEGTILTVIREASEQGLELVAKNPKISIDDFIDEFINFANISLENTPNLLPVLKEVGVVDSGGAGLLVVLEGMQSALKGEAIQINSEKIERNNYVQSQTKNDEFGYCTEFIIDLNERFTDVFDETILRNNLSRVGDSIVVVHDDDIVKVHIHTLTPGDVLTKCHQYGEFLKLKIENMQFQHENLQEGAYVEKGIASEEVSTEKEDYAMVTVAAGSGIVDVFKEVGAKYVISGGQTMNPSTEDFVEVIKKINADKIIILPNNSNIILAANQAKEALDDINITVLETKSIPQGLSACIMFDPEASLEDNIVNMNDAITVTRTAQVTYAIKDTSFNGLEIKENDYMGILEKDIVVTNTDKIVTTKELLAKLVASDTEIITLIKGEDVNSKELKEIVDYIESEFDVELELVEGEQPVYSFIFGA